MADYDARENDTREHRRESHDHAVEKTSHPCVYLDITPNLPR